MSGTHHRKVVHPYVGMWVTGDGHIRQAVAERASTRPSG